MNARYALGKAIKCIRTFCDIEFEFNKKCESVYIFQIIIAKIRFSCTKYFDISFISYTLHLLAMVKDFVFHILLYNANIFFPRLKTVS